MRSAEEFVRALAESQPRSSFPGEGLEGLLWLARRDDAFRATALAQAALEPLHARALGDALDELIASGIRPIVFKGSAMAYSVYDEAWMRTRSDTDLLVPAHMRAQVTQALKRAGYDPAPTSFDSVMSQTSFVRQGSATAPPLDVHWRISNSEVLARRFSHDELCASSRPLPKLHGGARQPSPAASFLIACMHLGSHRTSPYQVNGATHPTGRRLIWLLDLQLLAQRFAGTDWEEVAAAASEKGLGQVTLEMIESAEAVFGQMETLPGDTRARLRRCGRDEASRYLGANRRSRIALDLRAMTFAARARWLRSVLLPPPSYMHARAGRRLSPFALAASYARRLVSGIRRTGRRPRTQ